MQPEADTLGYYLWKILQKQGFFPFIILPAEANSIPKYGTVKQSCIQDDISCLLQRSYFYLKKKLTNSSSFMQIVVWETIEHDIFCISLKAVKLTSDLHSFKEHFLLSKIIFCRPHANFKILDLCNSFENQKCRKLWRLYH